MKVHPVPNRRNIILTQSNQPRPKKLRRLPHIFAKVLELPFYSDADVVIHETTESFRFVVDTDDDIGDDIRAQTIEIYPGVTKIVVQGTHVFNASMGEMELDVWRFRLPASTRPELATAAFSDGELVVTVPKGAGDLDNDEDDEERENGDEVWGEGTATTGPQEPEVVKYGDVFHVSGELATQPIAPQDAATMQAAENIVLGQTQKGGPASVMQSAAAVNLNLGVVGHDDMTGIAREQGVTISEAEVAGHRIITEAVGGEVVGQYVRAAAADTGPTGVGGVLDKDAITIGEALEATVLSAGDKPVDQSDAAAIQAAEIRATGRSQVVPGGVAAASQSAAAMNARAMRDEDKTKLGDVLADATMKLPEDKAVTRQDAEGVIGAEIRNKPDLTTHPGGVAASMAAAARLNQEK